MKNERFFANKHFCNNKYNLLGSDPDPELVVKIPDSVIEKMSWSKRHWVFSNFLGIYYS
jgi:hypothetical protein